VKRLNADCRRHCFANVDDLMYPCDDRRRPGQHETCRRSFECVFVDPSGKNVIKPEQGQASDNAGRIRMCFRVSYDARQASDNVSAVNRLTVWPLPTG
jgi:hypothetical protein